MSTEVLTEPYVSVGGVDLTDYIRKVTVMYGSKSLDDTTPASLGMETSKAGLKTLKMSFEFLQDFDLAKVEDTLFNLVGAAGVQIVLRVRSSSPYGRTYTATLMRLADDWASVDANIGDLLQSPVDFTPCKGNVFTRT